MKIKFFLTSLLITGCVVFSSCSENNQEAGENQSVDTMANNSNVSLQQAQYGSINGQNITQYTLTNASGMVVKIMNYGATITNILVPDSSGNTGDVALGFDSLDGYQKEHPYFGCIVGRFANRIAKGKFTLNGKTYQLPVNNGPNSLHGGIQGFNRKIWTAEPVGDNAVKLTYLSKDGEEGYPGNLTATVTYTLTVNNELKIDYTATTDQATPVNLTNHSYFNLSAGTDSTVLGHEIMLNADRFTEVDKDLIPTGQLLPVKGTSMDFTVPAKVGTDITKVAGGYDHNYVLNKSTEGALELAASVYHPATGRYMEVLTTQPGVQFYSGNFLDGSVTGKDGTKYVKHAGLCLETQHFPDSPNQPEFPNTILKPGENFSQSTVYKFSTK